MSFHMQGVGARTKNNRLSKTHTLKLEKESVEMEETLKELKANMLNRKNENEQNSGAIWQYGSSGSLSNYAKNMLSATSNSQKKSGKLLLLKNEPLVTSDIKTKPGKLNAKSTDDQRIVVTQSKCGQCEDKSAHVSCIECGEDYCAICFTSFHLKGALKKHRSVPFILNDRHKSEDITSISLPHNDRNDIKAIAKTEELNKFSDVKLPNRLVDGTFNEEESALTFQEALTAWRNGSNEKNLKDAETCTFFGRSINAAIQFNNHSLSYAERLLLQQHRSKKVPFENIYQIASYTEQLSDENQEYKMSQDETKHHHLDIASFCAAVKALDESKELSNQQVEELLYHPMKRSGVEISEYDHDEESIDLPLTSNVTPSEKQIKDVSISHNIAIALSEELRSARNLNTKSRLSSARSFRPTSASKWTSETGVLTVLPSSNLQALSRSSHSTLFCATELTEFYLLGQNKNLEHSTLSSSTKIRENKISTFNPDNKLYKMCLRSWTPVNSLPDLEPQKITSRKSSALLTRPLSRKQHISEQWKNIPLDDEKMMKEWQQEDDGLELQELEQELALLSSRCNDEKQSSNKLFMAIHPDENSSVEPAAKLHLSMSSTNQSQYKDTMVEDETQLYDDMNNADDAMLKADVEALDQALIFRSF